MKPFAYYKILAESDTKLFLKSIVDLGFKIEGRQNNSPLNKSVEEARIRSISNSIFEDKDEHEELPPQLLQIRDLAEALGFIISYDI
jgi:hypothetical protein